MKTALIAFLLALVAPTAALAQTCPAWADGGQFDVTIHLEQATPPAPTILWQLGPSAPTPVSFSWDSAPDPVWAQGETATAWRLLYSNLDYHRSLGRMTCEKVHLALQIAKRTGMHRSELYRAEAEAFWRIYLSGWPNRAVALQNPIRNALYMYTGDGDYPASDIADMLAVFGL